MYPASRPRISHTPNRAAPNRSTRSGVTTSPTTVLTPKSSPNATTLRDARRVSGSAGAGAEEEGGEGGGGEGGAVAIATAGLGMGPPPAGPGQLAEPPPGIDRAVVRLDF